MWFDHYPTLGPSRKTEPVLGKQKNQSSCVRNFAVSEREKARKSQAGIANRFFVMVVLAVLAIPSLTLADNTTLENAQPLILGEVVEESIESEGALWWAAHLVAGRSYSFSVWAPFTDPGEAHVNLSVQVFDKNGRLTPSFWDTGRVIAEPILGFRTQGHGASIIIPGEGGDQVPFMPAVTDTYFIRVCRYLPLFFSGPTPPAYPIHVLGLETTLFSPWYFIDAAKGYDSFVEIRNNSQVLKYIYVSSGIGPGYISAPLTATVTVYDSNGGIVGAKTVTIPTNGNTFIRIGAEFGISQGFGSVQIAHNGTLGAVCANTTTLSTRTGLSFDGPFKPRMSWSVFKR